jgi:hypothetical protein
LKVRISLLLIVGGLLVFAHQFLLHGTIYDPQNLFSHEAIATALIGGGVVAWGLKR